MQVLCRHKFSNQLGKYLVSRTIIGSYGKIWGFPGGSVAKNLPASAGDKGLIPGSGRSPGEGNGKPTPVLLPEKLHGLLPEEPGRRQSMESQRVGHN